MRTLHTVGWLPEEHTSWTKALSGDSDGFAAVFDCQRDRVYRHALRLTGNVHDAEDLTFLLRVFHCPQSTESVSESETQWSFSAHPSGTGPVTI